MADKLGGAAGPQPPEGSVEYRYAQVAREPRCEQEPVRFRHAAMDRGRRGTAGGMVAAVTALGAPTRTGPSPRRSTRDRGSSGRIGTTSRASASERGGPLPPPREPVAPGRLPEGASNRLRGIQHRITPLRATEPARCRHRPRHRAMAAMDHAKDAVQTRRAEPGAQPVRVVAPPHAKSP